MTNIYNELSQAKQLELIQTVKDRYNYDFMNGRLTRLRSIKPATGEAGRTNEIVAFGYKGLQINGMVLPVKDVVWILGHNMLPFGTICRSRTDIDDKWIHNYEDVQISDYNEIDPLNIHDDVNLLSNKIREIFHYDVLTGITYWRRRSGDENFNIRYAGKKAGSKGGHGYICVDLYGRTYRIHLIVWLYFYSEFPKNFIDHFDRNKTNNKIENLRDVTRAVNNENRTLKPGKSGEFGVHYRKRENKFVASFTRDGNQFSSSKYYMTVEEAKTVLLDGQAYYDLHGKVSSDFKQRSAGTVKPAPTQEVFQKLYYYDEVTGHMISRRTNKIVGYLTESGYMWMAIFGKKYFLHRLIFLYKTGRFPPEGMRVDHRNGIKTDNSWDNLSLKTPSENNLNILHDSMARGIGRVYWAPTNTTSYVAYITVNKKRITIGTFKTFEEAAEAWRQFRDENNIISPTGRDDPEKYAAYLRERNSQSDDSSDDLSDDNDTEDSPALAIIPTMLPEMVSSTITVEL